MPRPTAAILAAAVLVLGACDEAKRDDEGRVRTSGKLSVYDLRTGDCFNGGERLAEETGRERTVAEVTGVPCARAHDNEVFAVFTHPAGEDAGFPGEEGVNQVAQDGCLERFEDYVGRAYDATDLQMAVIAPGEESWEEEDDRTIVCVLYAGERLTGSQKASD